MLSSLSTKYGAAGALADHDDVKGRPAAAFASLEEAVAVLVSLLEQAVGYQWPVLAARLAVPLLGAQRSQGHAAAPTALNGMLSSTAGWPGGGAQAMEASGAEG